MPPETPPPQKSSQSNQNPGAKKMGTGMMAVAWVLAMLVLFKGFGLWEELQFNPNQNPTGKVNQAGERTVELQRNRYGHYVTSGTINNKPVTFMVDTGATSVSIPAAVAKEIGLKPGAKKYANTANGSIDVYATTLDKLTIGNITLRHVAADINPHYEGDGILLGMSVLKYLDFAQEGDTLTLRQF